MAVYWIAANDDKREYLDPTAFDTGAKFPEFAQSRFSEALLRLLKPAPEHLDPEGRWHGDRIRLVPDCTGSWDLVVYGEETARHVWTKPYTNISPPAAKAFFGIEPKPEP